MASLSGGEETKNGISLGVAPQSCKECHRRKARCDKNIPACGPCMRYRRHCLYEKHSRTALTRRHLTEVEEKLERAEALIRKLRRNNHEERSNSGIYHPPIQMVPLGEPELPISFSGHNNKTPDNNTSDRDIPPNWNPSEKDTDTPAPVAHDYAANAGGQVGRFEPSISLFNNARSQILVSAETNSSKASTGLIEKPPHDDFEWVELNQVHRLSPGPSVDVEDVEEDQIKDGMASLAVDDKEAGYLGVASGAALLRILEPNATHATPRPRSQSQSRRLPSILAQPDINRHITDTMIDAYFKRYHLNYPIVHEPTFRAQYSEVIPQPHGRSWPVLAYVIAAIGVYSSSTSINDLDLRLFEHAKSMLSFDFLEVGNLTLVQALTLISNLQQKRDKPNSGYNYLGLAVRMAIGLGLHKEFPGWNISPLNMEIRRRVWWSLCVFDVGASITFSRPIVWPYDGVEVSFPLNVTDRELTASSTSYPPENAWFTPHTAVSTQARFHTATRGIYSRVITRPFPEAEELLELDANMIQPWLAGLPSYFTEDNNDVPCVYAFAHAVNQWRYRNLRIIMYRSFVIRSALNSRDRDKDRDSRGDEDCSAASKEACDRCLEDARVTIDMISRYWAQNEHNCLAAWYALYFLFQAALIPCICLRNSPDAAGAPGWCLQISTTLRTILALAPANASSMRCYQVILRLCGRYLRDQASASVSAPFLPAESPGFSTPHQRDRDAKLDINGTRGGGGELGLDAVQCDSNMVEGFDFPSPPDGVQPLGPIDESPQTQINHVFPMMWPNATPLEAADEVMGDDAWLEFLRGV
ncbi:fungal-specific transcription factor domain-containing protein [Xylariaceae sp. FL0662B]|nr:fungal-specific transcription factor domain-containing protein [Xylariaceae sp. FL0662B]